MDECSAGGRGKTRNNLTHWSKNGKTLAVTSLGSDVFCRPVYSLRALCDARIWIRVWMRLKLWVRDPNNLESVALVIITVVAIIKAGTTVPVMESNSWWAYKVGMPTLVFAGMVPLLFTILDRLLQAYGIMEDFGRETISTISRSFTLNQPLLEDGRRKRRRRKPNATANEFESIQEADEDEEQYEMTKEQGIMQSISPDIVIENDDIEEEVDDNEDFFKPIRPDQVGGL
eukprot:m.269865 g.269865  ORF g.269865 m.269865 type:complete len:230 (-) comp16259_c0_seq44:4965-5654(-)